MFRRASIWAGRYSEHGQCGRLWFFACVRGEKAQHYAAGNVFSTKELQEKAERRQQAADGPAPPEEA